MLSTILLFTIRLYQKTLSPDHGLMRFFWRRGACIYRPTCSEYAFESIKRFGALSGSRRAAKRLVRCHPWHEGGYDPVV